MIFFMATSNNPNNELPNTVRLGQIAIAAGLAGRSLTSIYHDFPTTLLVELWRYYAQEVGEGEFVCIQSRRDLRKLSYAGTARVDDSSQKTPRIVAVYDGKLLGKMGWTVAMDQLNVDEGVRVRPALFSVAATHDMGDTPGAILDLYASPTEESAIVSWHKHQKENDVKVETLGDAAIPVKFPKPIDEICWPILSKVGVGLTRLRDCHVLRGLLAGACILNHFRNENEDTLEKKRKPIPNPCWSPPMTTRPFLICCRANWHGPPMRRTDELDVAMVTRENAYLDMLHSQKLKSEKPARIAGDETKKDKTAEVYRPREITRADLADLGNPNSMANRRLISFLIKQHQGKTKFSDLGLVRILSEEDWPESVTATKQRVKQLADLLLEWHPKQVRTRFDRLLRDKLIAGRRRGANGPWEYTLPEELSGRRSAFMDLPKPAEIRAKLSLGPDTCQPQTVCPDCPPLAQPVGQTEVQ